MKGFVIKDGMFKLAENDELLHARMERLLFTPISSAVGFIGQGSRVLNYFWEGATQQAAAGILSEIKMLVAAYSREVKLKKIGVRIRTPKASAAAELEVEMELDFKGLKKKVVVQKKNEGV